MQGMKTKGISGSTLKLIAIAAMIVDHTAATVLERMLIGEGVPGIGSAVLSSNMYKVYSAMRYIGRLGFPIFCFLLIEGFEHTKNVKKYIGRLALFAIISEIPFDLALSGKVFYIGYQNVFFTLLIGVLVIAGLRFIGLKEKLNKIAIIFMDIAVVVIGMLLAEYLKTDYSSIGVAIIVLLYVCRKNKTIQIAAGAIAFLWELTAPLAFIPIAFYNGKRGLNIKYFFYAFYPLHLFILYLIVLLMGLGEIGLRSI